MRHPFDLIERFRSDERGVFAITFAVMAIVLVAMAGAVVDFVSLQQARNRAQVALDAATLALHSQILADEVDEDAIRARAQALVAERISDPRITAVVDDIDINEETGSLYFTAHLDVPTIFVRLVGVTNLEARIQSEATRGSRNIEVAVALDLTGSMKDPIATGSGQQQTKVEALRAALAELINIVVQDQQTPTYSKMALVPYSMGVNVGTYAAAIRGPVTGPTAITGVTWANGTPRAITDASQTNPVIITSVNHGFQTGDRIYITGVSGMTNINGQYFTVVYRDANSFQLQGIDGRWYGKFKSSNPAGTATRCLTNRCELAIVSANHGLQTNEYVYITGTRGISGLNNGPNHAWKIGATNANAFALPDWPWAPTSSYGTYSSGGQAYCTRPGCEYYYFQNAENNSWRRHRISTCVTERTTSAYTDDPASTAYLGRNYPSTGNPCLPNTIVPLTPDKAALTTIASGLTATGSTAGHIGIGWAWYLVSPHFSGPWPAESQPAPADEDNILRAVVLMTDGEFNSVYYNGVISGSSTNGSGSRSDQINVAAPNGSSYFQAEELCEAMKEAGITVYTVGFDIVNSQNARNLMANCASSPSRAYQANTGQQLVDVFKEIGENLAQLRVTR